MLSQFLNDWEPKASREVSKAFHAATPSAKDKAHLKQLGLSEDEFPRERLTLVRQLKAKKNEIAALEQNGIAGVEPGKKYALVVYLGSAQMFVRRRVHLLYTRFTHYISFIGHVVSAGGHF